MSKECTCKETYTDYCPIHDGDYGVWKWGNNYEDYDEEYDE